MKNFKPLFSLLIMASLTACATTQLTLPYQPQTTEEIDAKIDVNTFGYYPPEGIAQNQIPETAMANVYLTEPVGDFITNAIRREFRQAGISLKGENICRLEGGGK